MDYSHFSNDDLKALQSGDYSKLSTAALSYISQNKPTTGPDLGQLQKEDQPVQPASPIVDALKAGGQGTEALGTLAGSGGDLQQAAQVAQGQPATTTGGKVGKIVGGMVSPAAIGTSALIGGVAKPLVGGVAEALSGPGQAELQAAKQSLTNLPLKYAQKSQQLEQLGGQAGKELEAAQAARGMGMTQAGVPTVPSDMNEFANSMLQISKKTPEQLNEAMDIKGLQGLKDQITIARQAGNLNPAQNAMVSKAADVIDSAIGKQAPEVGEALQTVRTVKDAQATLPNDQLLERVRLKNTIDSIRNDMRMSASTKAAKIAQVIAKGVGSAGLGLLGLKELKSLSGH